MTNVTSVIFLLMYTLLGINTTNVDSSKRLSTSFPATTSKHLGSAPRRNQTVSEGKISFLLCSELLGTIYIESARYGVIGCYSDVTTLISYRCHARKFCFFKATDELYDNHCENATKQLLIIFYYCIPKATTRTFQESDLLLHVNPPKKSVPPLTGLTKSCGRQRVSMGRIVNGVHAKTGMWPWQVAIYKHGYFTCGGSLINSNWIVTAAHCVEYGGVKYYKAVLGDFNRLQNEGHEYGYNVTRIVKNIEYGKASIHDKDIALIEIFPNVHFTDYIRPVCIPNTKQIEYEDKCFATGWGMREFPGSFSLILQQASMRIVDHELCQEKLNNAPGSARNFTSNMICTRDFKTNVVKGTCKGDSGGPLVCMRKADKRWYLRGVISWGSPRCNTTVMYNVFTKVSSFYTWIKNLV